MSIAIARVNMPIADMNLEFGVMIPTDTNITLTNNSNVFTNFIPNIIPGVTDVFTINDKDYIITSLSAVAPYSGTLSDAIDTINPNTMVIHNRFRKKLRVFVKSKAKLIEVSRYSYYIPQYFYNDNLPGIISPGLWRVTYKNYGVRGRQRIFYELLKAYDIVLLDIP